jgi:hypothetical protein
LIAQETRALLTRLARIRPFVLHETMVPAAAPSLAAQSAIEAYLQRGRRELQGKANRFLRWLHSPQAQRAPADDLQRRFTFLRMQLRGKKASRGNERGPGESGPRGGNVSLQGNRLVGVEAFASGARQYIATFDAAFTSCSLSVIDAKAGAAKIKRRGPDGSMFELDNVSTGSPSCSIQSGNAFAQ